MVKPLWVKVNPKEFQINKVNNRIIVGDDEFAVWGLGKTNGSGVTWADITKRDNFYEIAVGRKFGKKPRWKQYYSSKDMALKELLKKMKEKGRI